jgi:hypothetical protein
MIRVLSFDLSKLQVKEVGSLSNFVIYKLDELLAGTYVPPKMVDSIKASKKDFDGAVGSNANPEETKMLHAKDDLCDDSLQELKGLAVSATRRRDERMRDAGGSIIVAIRHRGYNMHEFRIPVQVDVMEQLIADIKTSPALTADMVTIGAAEVVERMETEVADLKAFWGKIQDGKAGDNLSSVEATRRMRAMLNRVFQYLNSISEYEPDVADAIVHINSVIEPFIIAIKSRATIRENNKKEAEQNTKS